MIRSAKFLMVSVLVLGGLQATAGASTSTPVSQRDLVIVDAGMYGITSAEKSYSTWVEMTWAVVNMFLTDDYRKIHYVNHDDATLYDFVHTLDVATAVSSVKAVDVVIRNRSLTSSVAFADGKKSMSAISSLMSQHLNSTQKKKLRVLYEFGAYSASHGASWVGMGFKAAAGSKKISNASSVSYAVYQFAFVGGKSFGAAIFASDAATPSHDVISTQQYLKSKGVSNWAEVDKKLVTTGLATVKISNLP